MVEGEDTALPGELDAEQESRYLRRQRAIAVRRRTFRGRLRRVLVGAVVLLPLSGLGYFLVSFGLASPRFALSSPDDVLVQGSQYVSRQEVLNALGIGAPSRIETRPSMFSLALEDARKQVESIAWVRSATVSRAYPHRLVVSIVERVPLAFANLRGRLKVVDSEGVFLDVPDRAGLDLPVLSGLEIAAGLSERKARLGLYQEFAAQVVPESIRSGWLISEVNLADADDLQALIVQGTASIQLHFGDRDYLERFRSLLALLPEMQKTGAKIDSVDLRYHNQVVVNPQRESGVGRRNSE